MSGAKADAMTLVADGRPRAVIILAKTPSPSSRLAAGVLQEHLRQMSGATVPIVSEDEVSGETSSRQGWIFVGEGRLSLAMGLSASGLGPGGMLMEAKGERLALLGPDLRTPSDTDGTLHAVVSFLEDKLGVRYLWPGELGKVVPRTKTIVVRDFRRVFTPKLAQRVIRDIRYTDRVQTGLDRLGFSEQEYKALQAAATATEAASPDWFDWQKQGGALRLRTGHAFGDLWKKHGASHPEWFALQPNGRRDQSREPDRVRLCKSNPGLIAAIAQEKIAELDASPDLLGVSIAPNDGGHLSFCGCPACEALDSPRAPVVKLADFSGWKRRTYSHAALTDRMVYFWNAIADQVSKVHPGKLLVVDAYSAYSSPPVSRTLHPNLVVRFVPMSYVSESERKEALDLWQAWSLAAKRIFYRPNFLYTGPSGAAHVYVHAFARDFRFMARRGMMGTDFDGCLHHWSTQGLTYYVIARLNWDPDQDIDAVVDDYCRSGFGAAAVAVREYFNRLEVLTRQVAEKELEPLDPFSPREIDSLKTILERARSLAAGDPVILKRIEFLETGLNWTGLEARAHDLLTEAGRSSKAARGGEILAERRAAMRDIFKNHFLAVNVASVSWGEDGLWKMHLPSWKQIRSRIP